MKTRKIKAQAAMEYLMTYGWAILIVVIVAAALYALGIFNPGTFTQAAATGFTGFSVPAGGWQASSTQVIVQLQNVQGSNINITAIIATYGAGTTSGVTPTLPVTLGPNGNQQFTLSGGTYSGPTTGNAYTMSVDITYTNLDTNLTGFTSSGTLTGTATA